MYVVDASVWVARLVQDDAHHTGSYRLLERLIRTGAPIVGPTLLLAEVAGAVSRRMRDAGFGKAAVSWLSELPNLELAIVDADLADRAAIVAADAGLKGADAVYVALAQELDLTLVTADHEQLSRGETVATVQTPEQALQDT